MEIKHSHINCTNACFCVHFPPLHNDVVNGQVFVWGNISNVHVLSECRVFWANYISACDYGYVSVNHSRASILSGLLEANVFTSMFVCS